VLARLLELHSQAEGPNLEAPLPEERPDVTPSWAADQLLAMDAVVRSFPPGSVAGSSRLRPQHLLDCLNSADSAAKAGLLEAVLTLVTSISSGHLHPRAAPYLCAARLIPRRKKDSGVRPIAVGDTLRRLVMKWLLATPTGGTPPPPLPRSRRLSRRGARAKLWPWECRPAWTPYTGARNGSCCRWI